MEYIPRQCRECGAIKSKMEDGKETLFPCKCDWGVEVVDRVKKTVHETYYDKMMNSWSPAIFSEANSGKFKWFVKMQKAVAIRKIYEFAFKKVTRDGVKVNSLFKSIATGRNLFIRGPKGSGRGLLLSCIKMLAAGRAITVSPLPGSFDAFKDDLRITLQMGVIGADARIEASLKYEAPSLLVLEGIKGEYITNYKGERLPKKHAAAEAIDRVLTRRLGSQGSVLLAGQDFVQEIGDTVGDRMFELLTSDKTDVVLLLSSLESDSLLTALNLKKENLEALVAELTKAKLDETKMADKNHIKESAILLQQALYFEKAFPIIPSGTDGEASHNMIDRLKDKHVGLPKKLRDAYVEFRAAEEAKDATYIQGIKDAQVSSVRECKVLSSRMSEREVEEIGRMIGLATQSKESVAKIMQQASDLRDEMAEKKRS